MKIGFFISSSSSHARKLTTRVSGEFIQQNTAYLIISIIKKFVPNMNRILIIDFKIHINKQHTIYIFDLLGARRPFHTDTPEQYIVCIFRRDARN